MNKTKKRAAVLLFILAMILALAAAGRFLAPNDPYQTNLSQALKGPSAVYPFGTDNLGRCILSRILEGAAASVFSALTVVAVVFTFGTLIGLIAGYAGGWIDQALMKVTMVFQAFPSFILAVAVAGMLGPGLRNAMISLAVMYWTTYARLARSLVIQLKEEAYIKAAKMCGAKGRHIIFRHILPNMISPLMITAALDISNVTLSMAGLSFLGLGVQAPLAEWGLMISNGRPYLQTAPWCIFFPSLALFVVVVLFNLTGDCLRDAIDDRGEG
ncbi:nickel transporter permease [Qiania dongpingensis]|uniref:ABC transporter permease subunit n=1 Tax=Qiania dongpingensis TaxID=2763669 RepID=A0A7G9G2L3_9FIRM|nr:nickel transporter permease [Qiania dongpingensis]QNM05045.1 ABC transporter permease subunit [Qiania dongpingensis]